MRFLRLFPFLRTSVPSNDVALVLDSLKESFIEISDRISSSSEPIATTNFINDSGDSVLQLDLIANKIISNKLRESSVVKRYVSEENHSPIEVQEHGLTVVFDPLDGSKNALSSMPTGTLFSIYRDNGRSISNLKGDMVVAAGYCLYSTTTELVVALRHATCEQYSLKNNTFHLQRKIQPPTHSNKILSVNFANAHRWEPRIARSIQRLMGDYTFRYTGCLVADIHQIITNGGIFMYPLNDGKGKIRLLYEAIPVSFILSILGGIGVTEENQSILELVPSDIHETVSCVFATSEEEIYLN